MSVEHLDSGTNLAGPGIMDVFDLHRHLIADYAAYTRSFIRIRDDRVRDAVESEIANGLLWPEPLLQLNPSFEPGATIPDLVGEGLLHEECGRIFRIKKHDNDFGKPLRLYFHQEHAICTAVGGHSYLRDQRSFQPTEHAIAAGSITR